VLIVSSPDWDIIQLMSSPLLRTKLFVPANRPKLVSRPLLIGRLNQGLHTKLALISAPAGFGKTTLAADWLHAQEAHPSPSFVRAWLSLDADDNDPVRFLTYLIASLNHIQGMKTDIGTGALQMIQTPQPPPLETIISTVINEITLATEKIVLVLDDYHLIDAPQVHESLNFLIENLPPQLHLVITTREDPPIHLARLRVGGQLNELRALDLRFTIDETANFVNQVMGLNLSAADISALESRTEGWIAGLQMAAISMQGSQDVEGFIRSFTGSHRYILDYLIEEVLEHQPESLQTFMLQTAILDRLTGSLCDAVTGQENGRETLDALERANLFIVPLDTDRQWFRYHHLFSDLLKQRLSIAKPELVAKLHRKASLWYASHDFQRRSISHAMAGDDVEMAADLIEANGLTLIGRGAYIILQKWINCLPNELVLTRPYLCVYHAWASNYSHQLEAVEPYLNNALLALDALHLPEADELYKDIQGHIATLQAQDARRQHNNPLAIELLIKAVDRLNKSNTFVRTLAELNLGLAYLDEGKLVKSATAFRNAIASGRASENDLATMIAISHLVAVLILQGRLHDGEKLCKQTIQDQVNRHTVLPPTTCMIFLRLGYILAEWNDAAGYFENLSKCIILADQIGYYGVVKSVSQSMKWYQQLLAGQGKIFDFSSEVSIIVDRIFSLEIYGSDSVLEIQTVENYLVDDTYFEIFPGFTEIARSKKLAQQNKVPEALSLLAEVYESAQSVEGIGLMIEARSAEALIYQSQGEIDQAIEALEDALSLSQSEGYIRTYADRGEPMKQLLVEVANRGVMADYTLKLLSAFEPDVQQASKPISQSLVDPLSKRELEVLQLIAEGLSRQEIASQLVLSLNTVKTHARNIFSKLGVNSQMQAVRKARALGLLKLE